jgi:hypothetical protein
MPATEQPVIDLKCTVHAQITKWACNESLFDRCLTTEQTPKDKRLLISVILMAMFSWLMFSSMEQYIYRIRAGL